MRIAIAGATGLIGSAITIRLARGGHEIMTIGRRRQSDVKWDLCAGRSLPANALRGCAALVHAAGIIDEDLAEPGSAFVKAIRGSRALTVAAALAGIGKTLYVSSAHVYGQLEGRLDEDSPPDPVSDYAIAHYGAEQIFRASATESGAAA